MFIITKSIVSLLNLFKGLLPQCNKFPLYSVGAQQREVTV